MRSLRRDLETGEEMIDQEMAVKKDCRNHPRSYTGVCCLGVCGERVRGEGWGSSGSENNFGRNALKRSSSR